MNHTTHHDNREEAKRAMSPYTPNRTEMYHSDSLASSSHRGGEGRDTMQPKIWYDYDKQVWVENGIIQDCGHPRSMGEGCCDAHTLAGTGSEYDPETCR